MKTKNNASIFKKEISNSHINPLSNLLKKKSFIYFSVLFGLMSFVACNKTKDFDDLDLLTKKKWSLVSIKQEAIEISDNCNLDDILFFENTKTFNYDFGLLNCTIEDGFEKKPTSWKLINDFTEIRMKFKFKGERTQGTIIEYWEILELNDTLLILKDATAENNSLIPEIKTYNN